MEIRPTALPDVMLLRPRKVDDARGHFVESYNQRAFARAGITARFVQDNQSLSRRRGTLRGLHFQYPPKAQAKLVRVLKGAIFDVAIDLRAGSPHYGRWVGETLSADGGEELFIPRGFAHGFCTLEDDTEVAYKVDGFYAPAREGGLIWNDTDLAIVWPVAEPDIFVSGKDATLGRFADFVSPFFLQPPVASLAS